MSSPDIQTVGVRAVVEGVQRYEQDLRRMERATDRTGQQIQRGFGGALRRGAQLATAFAAGIAGATAGIAGLQAAFRNSIIAAIDFESSMTRIETLVGLSREAVQGMQGDVLELAGATAKAPTELADALFVVTSAGERGAEAMNVLEQAAKASAIGLGQTDSIARTVTASIQAYGSETLDAERATNVLVGTVREGNLEAEALAGSLGRVLGPAAQLGVEMNELGAFIATYTRLGVSAEEATTGLRGVLSKIIKPTERAKEELQAAGLSVERLREVVAEEGLDQALFMLRDAFEGNQEALGRVFEDVEALNAVLAVTGEQSEEYGRINRDLRGDLDLVNEGFERVQETAEFKLNQALNDLRLVFMEIASTALPALVSAGSGAVEFFSTLIDLLRPLGPFFDFIIENAPTAAAMLGALLAQQLIARALTMTETFLTFADSFRAFVSLVMAEGPRAMAVLGPGRGLTGIATGLTPGLIGVSAAIGGLDIAFRQFTGKGLIERVIELFKQTDEVARGAADALEEIDRRARIGFDRTAASMDILERSLEELPGVTREFEDALADYNGLQTTVGREASDLRGELGRLKSEMDFLRGQAEGAVEQLLETDDGIRLLVDAFPRLTGEIRESVLANEDAVFFLREHARELISLGRDGAAPARERLSALRDVLENYREVLPDEQVAALTREVIGLSRELDTQHESARDAADEMGAYVDAAGGVGDLPRGVAQQMADEVESSGKAARDSRGPFERYVDSLSDVAGEAVSAEDALAELREEVDDLTRAFLEANPEYRRNALELTMVEERIAELEAKTGDLTAAEERELDALEKRRDELQKTNSELEAQAEVVDEAIGISREFAEATGDV
ncbi:MAG: phage tail tape measure protein, partial [Myxococcota bacterium]